MAAIDQKINLIGVPQVTQGLDQVIAKTKQTVAAVNNIGVGSAAGQAAQPIEIFNISLKNSAAAMKETESSGRALAEALHVLHPILGEVGGGLGELGAFARLASAGFELFAVAAVGAAAVKLTLLSDELAKAKGKLGDLLGSQAAGTTAFETISKDAEKLGTSVDGLLPAFEQLIRAGQNMSSIHFFAAPGQDLPELISGTKQAADAVTGLFTVLRAGHASLDEADKATGDFATALQNAGGLTKQVASVLLPFPKAFDALKTSLGGAGQTTKQFLDNLDKAPISFQRVSAALQQLSNQIPLGFDPKAPQGLKDAIEQLWNAVKEGLQIEQPKGLEKFIADLAPKVKALAQDFALLVPPAIDTFIDFGKFISSMFVGIKKDIQDVAIQYSLLKTLFSTTDLATFKEALKQIFSPNPQPIADMGQGLDELKKKMNDAADAVARVGQAAQTASGQVDTFKSRWEAMSTSVADSAKKLPGQINAPPPGGTAAPPGSVFAPTSEGAPGGFVSPPKIDAKNLFDPSSVADAVKALGNTINQSFEEFKFTNLTDGVDTAITQGGATGAQNVQQSMSAITFSDMASNFDQAMGTIEQAAQSTWDRIVAIFSQQLPSPSGGFGFSGTPLAGGGLVTGGGTGTSDSIPAWLSNREFVLTAASTKFWGEGLLNWMNKAPRFAGGGAVTSQSAVVHLHLGNESFAMNASENVATALRQHAVKSRLVSTGRKPSWY